MGLPKNKRKIVVKDQCYYWIVTRSSDVVNLTIENQIQNRLRANFNYNTLNPTSSSIVFPFTVTPYIVKEAILNGHKQGYSNTTKQKELDLGNLTQEMKLLPIKERKVKKLLSLIETRINLNVSTFTSTRVDGVRYVVKDTRELIKCGELIIGIENMIDNLAEFSFKYNQEELILIKEFSELNKMDWRVIWKDNGKLK